MKNRYLILALAISMISCSKKSETKDSSKQASQVVHETAIVENKVTIDSTKSMVEEAKEQISYRDYTGVIIHSCEVFKEMSMESDVVAKVKQGIQVKINEKSESREKAGIQRQGDVCMDYGYYWYNVTTPGGEEGWVFGENLGKKSIVYNQEEGERFNMEELVGKKTKINGKYFYFDAAIDLNIGPSDEEGLTGCDCHYYPYFYAEGEPNVYFINAKEEFFEGADYLVRSSDGILEMVMSSEGGSASILEIVKAKDGTGGLQFKNSHGYQDGGAKSEITFSWKNEYEWLSLDNYELRKENY